MVPSWDMRPVSQAKVNLRFNCKGCDEAKLGPTYNKSFWISQCPRFHIPLTGTLCWMLNWPPPPCLISTVLLSQSWWLLGFFPHWGNSLDHQGLCPRNFVQRAEVFNSVPIVFSTFRLARIHADIFSRVTGQIDSSFFSLSPPLMTGFFVFSLQKVCPLLEERV